MGFFIAPSAFVSSSIACDTRLCRLATRDIASAKTVINSFDCFCDCNNGIFSLPRLLLCRRLSPATLGSADSQRETSLRQKLLSTVLCLALPFPSPKVMEGLKIPTPQTKKERTQSPEWVIEFFCVRAIKKIFLPFCLRDLNLTDYSSVSVSAYAR